MLMLLNFDWDIETSSVESIITEKVSVEIELLEMIYFQTCHFSKKLSYWRMSLFWDSFQTLRCFYLTYCKKLYDLSHWKECKSVNKIEKFAIIIIKEKCEFQRHFYSSFLQHNDKWFIIKELSKDLIRHHFEFWSFVKYQLSYWATLFAESASVCCCIVQQVFHQSFFITSESCLVNAALFQAFISQHLMYCKYI